MEIIRVAAVAGHAGERKDALAPADIIYIKGGVNGVDHHFAVHRHQTVEGLVDNGLWVLGRREFAVSADKGDKCAVVAGGQRPAIAV